LTKIWIYDIILDVLFVKPITFFRGDQNEREASEDRCEDFICK